MEWKGEISFLVDPGGVSGVGGHDICQFFVTIASLYPPPVAGLKQLPSTGPTWKKLSHDIQYTLHKSGSTLILNGSNGACHCMGRKDDSRSKSKKTNTHM
eukprot:15223038-Ditylum_brightwellii.AAC.1